MSEQTVVVLGASSGIGRATALEFGRQGARVVVASRGVEALGTLVGELTDAGAQALPVPTDITDEAAVAALVAAAEERFGRIDTWVTASAVSVYGTVADITLEEFRRVMEVNFLGHVSAAKAAVPALERAGAAAVLIGVGSVEGYRAFPLHAPYSASKFALRGFYDALRQELADAHSPVAVTSILPASIGTPFFEHSRSKTGSMPKPPPPVYAPELVAEAIVRAAEHPRREIPVGDAALGFIAGQRINPALTEAVLSVIGPRAQQSDRPDDGTDILDTPTPGPGAVRGAFADKLVSTSPVSRAAGALVRPGELLLRARRRGPRG